MISGDFVHPTKLIPALFRIGGPTSSLAHVGGIFPSEVSFLSTSETKKKEEEEEEAAGQNPTKVRERQNSQVHLSLGTCNI